MLLIDICNKGHSTVYPLPNLRPLLTASPELVKTEAISLKTQHFQAEKQRNCGLFISH